MVTMATPMSQTQKITKPLITFCNIVTGDKFEKKWIDYQEYSKGYKTFKLMSELVKSPPPPFWIG